jgi:hypothetical protein
MAEKGPGRAILANTLPQLETFFRNRADALLGRYGEQAARNAFKPVDGLWFGVEFCVHRMPATEHIFSAADHALRKGMRFTLVTPYAAGRDLDLLWDNVRPVLAEKDVVQRVTVNDWGMLARVRQHFPRIPVYLGRVLNRQRTSPQLVDLLEKPQSLPRDFWDYAGTCAADNARFAAWLKSIGVAGSEQDNPEQGVRPVRHRLARVLHWPWVYVTTTRRCGYGNYTGDAHGAAAAPLLQPVVLPARCGRQCEGYLHELSVKEFGVGLVLNGNTQFYFNDQLPEDLSRFQFVVEHCHVPC